MYALVVQFQRTLGNYAIFLERMVGGDGLLPGELFGT